MTLEHVHTLKSSFNLRTFTGSLYELLLQLRCVLIMSLVREPFSECGYSKVLLVKCMYIWNLLQWSIDEESRKKKVGV